MSRMVNIVEPVELYFTDCPTCGVLHGFPKSIFDQMGLRPGPGGMSVFCPNGHRWHRVLETEAEKWRREAQRAQQQLARLEDEKRDIADRMAMVSKKLLRTQKRAAAALCPCCNRSFANVARHMKIKHPEVVPINAMDPRKKVRA